LNDPLVAFVAVLDATPDVFRGLLFAGVLAVLLPVLHARLPAGRPGLVASGGRAVLLLLLLAPLFGALVPVRWVVVVETPSQLSRAPWLFWLLLVAVWAAGAVARLRRDLAEERSLGDRLDAAKPAPEALVERSGHWQRRLGLRRPVQLCIGPALVPLTRGLQRRLYLPDALLRWPAAVQDALLAHGLACSSQGIGVWRLLGRRIAALYWFVPAVRAVGPRLAAAQLRIADERAAAATMDTLGYERALRHLADRLPDALDPAVAEAALCGDAESLRDRARALGDLYYTDPAHGRVFWTLVFPVLLAFLCAGGTLRVLLPEDPPDVLVFRNDWHGLFRPGEYENRGVTPRE
jgi:hypothetical protein